MSIDQQSWSGQSFEYPEGLRELLSRLNNAEGSAWRTDPEAAALMRHAARKYAGLARKHGLDPWEAAGAAFDVMRTPAVRRAGDPWAVVTRAVQITCIAEERANGLLCSVHQARRPRYSAFHDVERFSDRENPLPDYHTTLRVDPFADDEDAPADSSGAVTGVSAAIEDAIALLTALGWPPQSARSGVEYLCARLSESSSRASALDMLRRDRSAAALMDLPPVSWAGLLRIMLGSAEPALAHTGAGRGVLLRLLVGEPLRGLLADDRLVQAVSDAVPEHSSRREPQ